MFHAMGCRFRNYMETWGGVGVVRVQRDEGWKESVARSQGVRHPQ